VKFYIYYAITQWGQYGDHVIDHKRVLSYFKESIVNLAWPQPFVLLDRPVTQRPYKRWKCPLNPALIKYSIFKDDRAHCYCASFLSTKFHVATSRQVMHQVCALRKKCKQSYDLASAALTSPPIYSLGCSVTHISVFPQINILSQFYPF